MERIFKLKENKTNVRTELIAGLTTFMTMAYVLVVVPDILSAAGIPIFAALGATCISAFIACLANGFYSNYPFALAPGMGLVAFFSFTVVGQMGISWQQAFRTSLYFWGYLHLAYSNQCAGSNSGRYS